MIVRHHLYPEQKIFHLDLNSGISASRALEQMVPVLEARPELWSWDWIVEARVVPEDVTVTHIERLATMFRKPDRPAITVFATDDRFMHLWARVMDFQFPGRRHLIASSAVAGVGLIGKRRSATKMN